MINRTYKTHFEVFKYRARTTRNCVRSTRVVKKFERARVRRLDRVNYQLAYALYAKIC